MRVAATSCLEILSDSVASRRKGTPFIRALEGLHGLPIRVFCPYFNSPAFQTNHSLHVLYLLSVLPEIPALFTLAFPAKPLPSLFLSSIRQNAPVHCRHCLCFSHRAHSLNSAHLVGAGTLARTRLPPFKHLWTQR